MNCPICGGTAEAHFQKKESREGGVVMERANCKVADCGKRYKRLTKPCIECGQPICRHHASNWSVAPCCIKCRIEAGRKWKRLLSQRGLS